MMIRRISALAAFLAVLLAGCGGVYPAPTQTPETPTPFVVTATPAVTPSPPTPIVVTPTREARTAEDCVTGRDEPSILWPLNPNPCMRANGSPIGSHYSNLVLERVMESSDNRHQVRLVGHNFVIRPGLEYPPPWINYIREDEESPRGMRIEVDYLAGDFGYSETVLLRGGVRYVFKIAGFAELRGPDKTNVTLDGRVLIEGGQAGVINLDERGIDYDGYNAALWVVETERRNFVEVTFEGFVSARWANTEGAFTMNEFAVYEAPPEWGQDVLYPFSAMAVPVD